MPDDPAPAPDFDDARPLVLVVDDDAQMSRFVANALASGYRTVIAQDGREGLEKARSLHPDVIVTGITMPPMGGDAMVREIRAYHELDDVPIVSLTATADDELRVRLLREGTQDYVTKPFSVEELRARVGNLVATKRARAVLQRELASTSHDLAALASELAARKGELEAALRKVETANRLKDEFLSRVSHELRTPLTPILGWARVLRRGKLDDASYQRALEIIERNGRAQAKTIDDLLDRWRLVSGTLPIDRRTVDLPPIIEMAGHQVGEAAEEHGIELHVALDRDVGPVWGDAERLLQVVSELLANAIKFTASGGRVDVRLDRVAARARIVVSDTGPGISAEVLPHVFEGLRPTDDSVAREHRGLGLGLGLSIARDLVELHGGSIRAESNAERPGTIFTVELPLMDPGSA